MKEKECKAMLKDLGITYDQNYDLRDLRLQCRVMQGTDKIKTYMYNMISLKRRISVGLAIRNAVNGKPIGSNVDYYLAERAYKVFSDDNENMKWLVNSRTNLELGEMFEKFYGIQWNE